MRGFLKESKPFNYILCEDYKGRRRHIFGTGIFDDIDHAKEGLIDVKRRYASFSEKTKKEISAPYIAEVSIRRWKPANYNSMSKEELLREISKLLELDDYSQNLLLHDVNNLRGNEWISDVGSIGDANLTKAFKRLIGKGDNHGSHMSDTW